MHINEVSYHRNGVGGTGFYAIRFTDNPMRHDEHLHFLATVFPESGNCAVICTDMLAEHGVQFGRNSWRGDDYEDALRAVIADYEKGEHHAQD